MKYIVLKVELDDATAFEVPVIFPNELVHKVVAETMVPMLRRSHKWEAEPVAAGEINLSVLRCSGASESLSLDLRTRR